MNGSENPELRYAQILPEIRKAILDEVVFRYNQIPDANKAKDAAAGWDAQSTLEAYIPGSFDDLRDSLGQEFGLAASDMEELYKKHIDPNIKHWAEAGVKRWLDSLPETTSS